VYEKELRSASGASMYAFRTLPEAKRSPEEPDPITKRPLSVGTARVGCRRSFSTWVPFRDRDAPKVIGRL
jgi:hypothetical protein